MITSVVTLELARKETLQVNSELENS
jgi:hypothetical protein